MSIWSDHSMTNHHGGLFTQLSQTLQIWRERQRQRRELARWSERDLHDVGLSSSELINEIEKPFWRA